MNIFEGIRVLDFTNNLAGPYAAAMLSDYGAEVIHVEKPVLGDDNRAYLPRYEGQSMSFMDNSHGKKSLVLDLKDPEAVKIVEKLVKETDVLIESYRPGVMKRLGLDYEAMKKVRPDLIYCSVSAFGQTGPEAGRAGYDIIAQAVSGLMYMTGDQDGPPRKVGITVGDNVGALTAFGAIGAALYYRERTGIGQQIDVSLVKTLMWMSNKIDDLVLNGHMQHRNGNHHLTLCPYGLFSGNNGDAIVIATISQRLWEKLCNVIERPDLIDDPKFVTNEMRCRNQQELIGIIEGWIKSFGDIREAESKLMNAGIPCSKVYDHKDLCENEHYREAGWIVDMPLSDDVKSIRTKKSVGNPFQFSECEAHYGKAPVLGQNNLEILSSLGYSDDKAEELEDKWDRKARKK